MRLDLLHIITKKFRCWGPCGWEHLLSM